MAREFEVMYIVKPIADAAFKVVVDSLNKVITTNGGTVKKTDFWGKKHLAYEIQDLSEGLYVLVTFTANMGCVKELDRIMRDSDLVMRHMLIQKGC